MKPLTNLWLDMFKIAIGGYCSIESDQPIDSMVRECATIADLSVEEIERRVKPPQPNLPPDVPRVDDE